MPLAHPKIVDVERIVLNVPFTPRCEEWNAREVRQWKVSEVIRVTTDSSDLVGYGETILHYTWGRVSDSAIERVRGGNAASFLGDDSLGAGLQMALYDLVGKTLGVPVHRLLNLPQVREWCPISWWNIDMPPEALAEEASDAVAQGYTSLKTKARPWWDVHAQVEAMAKVTPPHFRIDLDWNMMLLNAGNAAPVLQELDREERIALYESPILQWDVEGHRQLRQKTTRPLALHFGDPAFPVAARDEVCDGFVVAGGVARIMNQAALAAAFNKPFFLQMVGTGLTTALSLHLGAVLPYAQWPAVNCLNNYADDLLTSPITIKGGYAQVPEAPGLGIEIDEAALSRYSVDAVRELETLRHILSVVWPGGRVVHYATMRPMCWTDSLAGNVPPQERGVRMEVHYDDGTSGWADLYARASRGPVRDRR